MTTISDSVVQFGTEMIPLGRLNASLGFTSGTTRGTSGSIRKAPDLSITTTPCSAATGAHASDTSSGTSNMAISTPSECLRRDLADRDLLAADRQHPAC